MKFQEFQKKCQSAGYMAVNRIKKDGIYVYVAEGYSNGTPEYDKPHWKTLWAVGDGDKMDVMRTLMFDFGKGNQESRMSKTIQDAMDFVRSNKQAGRYE